MIIEPVNRVIDKPILVLSVPHSGTMFVYDLLPFKPATSMTGPWAPGFKYWAHVTEPHAMSAVAECFTIVPVRRYPNILQSWRSRRLDLTELDRQLKLIYAIPDLFFFPIDTPCREARFYDLQRLFDLAMFTDWSPVNRFT